MDAFEHLAVLVSIVIGLGISHLLTGIAQVLHAWIAHENRRVRPYWLQGVWVFNLFVLQVQLWWAFFGRSDELPAGTFFTFFLELVILVPAYLASVLTFPEIREEDALSLKDYYFRSRRWVFPLLAAIPLLLVLRAAYEGMPLHSPLNLARALFAALMLSLGMSRNEKYHAAVTLAGLALFLGSWCASACAWAEA